MSIHQLRLQFDTSFWMVYKDLVKLEALEEQHIPPGDVLLQDLSVHLAAHEVMTRTVSALSNPIHAPVS